MIKKVLFVCTGNTCRSPMAAAYFKHITGNSIDVKSAGTSIARALPKNNYKFSNLYNNFSNNYDLYYDDMSTVSKNAVDVLKKYNIDISDHKPTQLTKQMVDDADIIICMEKHHCKSVIRINKNATSKVYSLGEFGSGKDIYDPYGGNLKMYKKTLEQMKPLLNNLYKFIINKS